MGSSARRRGYGCGSDAQNWRVDSIDSTGERDLHHDAAGTWSWNYESGEAQRTGEPIGFGARWLLVGTLHPAALRAALASLPRLEDYGFFGGRHGATGDPRLS